MKAISSGEPLSVGSVGECCKINGDDDVRKRVKSIGPQLLLRGPVEYVRITSHPQRLAKCV